MRNLKIILLTVFATIYSIVAAQQSGNLSGYKIGQETELPKKSRIRKVLGHDTDHIYLLCYYPQKLYKLPYFTVEHFNKNLDHTGSKEIDLSYRNIRMKYEFSIVLKNRLHVFSSFLNTQSEFELHYHLHNLDSTANEFERLLKVQKKPSAENPARYMPFMGAADYWVGAFSWEYCFSPDSTKLLIYHVDKLGENNNQQLRFAVFDNQLKLLYNLDTLVDDNLMGYGLSEYKINNDGTVYYMDRCRFEGEKGERKKEPQYYYKLYCIDRNGTRIRKQDIDLDGKFITGTRMSFDKDNHLYIVGLYSNIGRKRAAGYLCCKVDGESFEIQFQKHRAFGRNVYIENQPKKEREKMQSQFGLSKTPIELKDHAIQDIIKADDGLYLLTEFYIKEPCYDKKYPNRKDKFMETDNKTTKHNDIIVFKINNNGVLLWSERVPKRQIMYKCGQGYWSSFASLLKDDYLYIIFNDNPANLHENGMDKLDIFMPHHTVVALVKIDKFGSLEKKEHILGIKETGTVLRPVTNLKQADNKLIMWGHWKDKMRAIQIELY